MKKMVCILMVMVCAGMAFAQAKPAAPAAAPAAAAPAEAAPEAAPAAEPAKNGIALDLFPLFKGIIASDSANKLSYFCIAAGYERLATPHLSLGANMNMYFGSWDPGGGFDVINANYFSLAGELRIYPQSENFEKTFVGATLGFNMLSVDGKTDPKDGGFFGLTTSLKAGYKLITSKGIYIEPSMSYVLSKSPMIAEMAEMLLGVSIPTPLPLGWEGGFRIGYAF